MGTAPSLTTVAVKQSIPPSGTLTVRSISPTQSISPSDTSALGLPPSAMVSVEETTTRLPTMSSAWP